MLQAMRHVWKQTPPLAVLMAVVHKWKPTTKEETKRLGPKEQFEFLMGKKNVTGQAALHG